MLLGRNQPNGQDRGVVTSEGSVRDALGVLRARVKAVRLPLEAAGAADARRARHGVLAQLDDYVMPRLRQLDAPLLAVVGGSTGAGKSTLVNAIVGHPVSEAGVLRPTTRSPVLVHHPDDTRWFEGDRILPGFARFTGSGSAGGLRLVADAAVPAGLALLDAPDIDSVVTENRELAAQLLAAADLWLFVTTAARYADAVPWDLLGAAAERSASVSVVLDRVPPGAIGEIRSHLAGMLAAHGLGDAPLFVVPEVVLDEESMLPPTASEEIRSWLHGLAADEAARTAVVRRTLDGAVRGLVQRMPALADAADEQVSTAAALLTDVESAYGGARSRLDDATGDGSLLRGEVLARWQDFIGTGDFYRSLEARVGRVRDQVTAFLRGRPQPAAEVEEAIESGVQAVVVEEANRAAEQADAAWRASPAGRALLGEDDLSRAGDGLVDRSAEAVRAWQAGVLDLVRTEGADKRFTARLLSFGVNGLGLALMIVVFASTAGLTGAEIGVAGGTAIVGQKLLEAIFGDQAVRRLAAEARADLNRRAEELMADESARFTSRLDELKLVDGAGAAVRSAADQVERVREAAA